MLLQADKQFFVTGGSAGQYAPAGAEAKDRFESLSVDADELPSALTLAQPPAGGALGCESPPGSHMLKPRRLPARHWAVTVHWTVTC